MPPPVENLISRLEQLEESLRSLVSLLTTSTEPFETAWDTANRVCDRYYQSELDEGIQRPGSQAA